MTDPAPEPAANPEPAPAPEPPAPPKVLNAHALMTPVKGQKVKPVTVKFTQREGEQTAIASEAPFEGLAKGNYHLVVHEAAECGPNATKAGKAWADWTVEVKIEVGADKKGTVEKGDLAILLEGEKAIVGRTLVLHTDAKGKPGKPVACGAIALFDAQATPAQ